MPSLFTRIEDGRPVDPEHVRALQRQVQALSRSFGGIPGYVDSTGYHPRRQASGDNQNVIICKLVATSAVTASGTQTIDGTSTSAGMLVLLTNQATPANNGVWKCAAAAWTKQTGPYDAVGIISGTDNALSWWIMTAATPTYAKTSGGGGGTSPVSVAKAASTGDLALSGTQTIDGVACSADDVVLAKDQSSTGDRGTYTVKSTAWVKIGIPDAVVVMSGTANGRLLCIRSTNNAYVPAYAAVAPTS